MASTCEISLKKEISEHLKSAKAANEHQVNENTQTITKAKGRAQITATTAMSIVNVALFKGVIDLGPERNRYYILSLVLIAASLCLQVIAGLLSIMIENVLSYLNQYNHNLCEEVATNCCPWRCISRQAKRNMRRQQAQDVEMQVTNNVNLNPIIHKRSISHCSDLTFVNRKCCMCSPLVCSADMYEPHEEEILEKHKEWKNKFLTDEHKILEIKGEVCQLNNNIKYVKERLAALCGGENDVIAQEKEDLKSSLEEKVKRRLELEGMLWKAEVSKDQGELVVEYSESVRKSRIMRLATYWQLILNYMFYVIFVLNAVITGFGLGTTKEIWLGTGTSEPAHTVEH